MNEANFQKGKEMAMNAAEDKAKQIAEESGALLRHYVDNTYSKAKEMGDEYQAIVRRHPISTVCGAFIAGALFAKLLSK